jgi:hypothetical protein
MITLNLKGRVVIAIVALLVGGCAPSPRPRDERLDLHAVRFDADGKTIDLQTGKSRSSAQTKAQFDKILSAIDAAQSDRHTRRILLFVHGGLNKPEKVLDRIKDQLDEFEKHAVDFYPIYVVWDSSLDATYAEHLFAVRQGRKDSRTRAAASLSWPIYLLSDIMRAAARAPTVWLQQRSTDDQAVAAAWASMFGTDQEHAAPATRPAASTRPARTQAWLHHPRNDKTVASFDVLYDKYLADWHANGKQTSQIAISIGQDYSEPSDWMGRGFVYSLTFPTKMLTSPLIDALGSAGWRDMSRRTQTIVEGASDFEIGQGNIRDYVNSGAPGGLDAFFRRLASRQHDPRPGHPSYDITLVGHSMGSMVLNEALRRQTQREQDGGDALPVTRIIYMAAACSIRDFTESVIPFLALHEHERTRFYNLCLHPTAELIESNAYDIPPRGSLLAWIDDFLTEPSTPLDRTLGRWENLVQVPYVIPAKMRGRVAIKAFDLLRPGEAWYARPDPQPQQHGDFSGAPYWDENFITPTPPEDTGQRHIKSATTRRVGNLEREAQQQQQGAAEK